MEILPGYLNQGISGELFGSFYQWFNHVCISIQRLERCCVIYFTLMALINGFLKSKGRLQSYVECSGSASNTERKTAGWAIEWKGCGLTITLFLKLRVTACDWLMESDWCDWSQFSNSLLLIALIKLRPGILIYTESNDKCVMTEESQIEFVPERSACFPFVSWKWCMCCLVFYKLCIWFKTMYWKCSVQIDMHTFFWK